MDKLDKAREEICKDCMYWTVISNCSECLFNVLRVENTEEKNR